MSHYSGMMSGVTQGSSDAPSFIDFRSDTVTKPSDAMKKAAMAAPLGDDVYEEDPTVIALEAKIASMLGKEAALFFPTGTQSNLAAILVHCHRGEEVLVGDQYHIYRDEARGASVLGGVTLDPLVTDKFGGVSVDELERAIKPDDPHCAITKLLCLENTVSGMVQSQEGIDALADKAHQHDLLVHLDGARLFNAAVAQGIDVSVLARNVDTVSICLSKGLGAPIGSVLIGPKDFIHKARRQRKLLGGGMRQVGFLAACGLYGLEENVPNLRNDHERARRLANELAKIEELNVDLEKVQTNMLFIEPDPADANALRSFFI